MRTGVVFFLGLSACGAPTYPPAQGPQVWKMFPFDGEREWTYVNTDASLPYKLVVTSDPAVVERKNNKNVYTLVYTVDCVNSSQGCVDEPLFKLRWSSDNVDGTFIHAYGLGEDPSFIDFDPPLQITFDDMSPDQVAETQTGGAGWTSTMGPIGECADRMGLANFDTCGTWTVTTDGGTGFPIAGQWWAAEVVGVTGFQLAGETEGRWELSAYDCEPDIECDGIW